jgi:hypothetical protein
MQRFFLKVGVKALRSEPSLPITCINYGDGGSKLSDKVTNSMETDDIAVLRRYVTLSIIGLFILNTVCAVSCVYFVGFGLMNLPQTLIHYLMVQTIGNGAAIFLIIARSMFPVKKAPARGRPRRTTNV